MNEEQKKAYEEALSKVLDLGVALGLENEDLSDMVDNLLNPDVEEKEEEDEDEEVAQ